MNRVLDFSERQIRFIGLLSLTAVVMGGYLLIKSYSLPSAQSRPLEIFIGENDKLFTGLFVIDPNTAPADSLELLPGIGRVLADRIVAYREDHRFAREVDITDVNGIGPKTFERLRPYLKIKQR